ncbi:MAG: hypothetical protein NUV67_04275, partial [archaeon]|nr:hypothetical protein [archaeon]
AKITVLDGFSYEKDYGDGSCENEFCLAAFTRFDGKIIPNKEHAGKIHKAPAKAVVDEIHSQPGKYPVWFKETVALVVADSNGRLFFK